MTQAPVQVGNSVQQQQAPGPDSEIQQHTIQEENYKTPQNLLLPQIDLHLDGRREKELLDRTYNLLTQLNEEYRFSQDALETLEDQGIIGFLQQIEQEGIDWQSETHMPWWWNTFLSFMPGTMLGNLIDMGINNGFTMSQKRTHDDLKDLGLEALGNIIGTAIGMIVPFGRTFQLVVGGITAIVQIVLYGLSFASKDQGQEAIDEWYEKAQGKITQTLSKGNVNIFR